jgi:protein-S-isoprenylcysteine O-methyltransferase Ste14
MSKKLVAIQIMVTLLTYALPLWLPAGIRLWPTAWIFLGLWLGFWGFILLWLSRQNPALLQERMQIRTPDQKGWDRLMGPLVNVSLFLWLLFTAFDAGRFHWSRVPIWVQGLGVLILFASFVLFFLTFRENSFLSPLVRIQEDREQKVISTGVYSRVRHPMYAATLVASLGASLLLGSWYGILAGLIVALTLGCRALLEERSLQQSLPGYPEYLQKVKYRFIPYIW